MNFKFLQNIKWIKSHKDIFTEITRGIERETLRITLNGNQSIKNHPKSMGSSLTHKWITTDFSENLLEFITPKTTKINILFSFLRDLYRYTCKNLNKERMWPLSMPYFNTNNPHIHIANYGKSNIGKIKQVYRQGLKNRYGIHMNTISGLHYNFSFPLSFWKEWKGIDNFQNGKKIISDGYLGLIRNYHRFGWIIPYFFGASPTISSFIENDNTNKYPFKEIPTKEHCKYLPWATSLRISSMGHNNFANKILNIKYNSLSNYINKIKLAMNTPFKNFIRIGMYDNIGNLKQINTNLLQMENEFYSQIRPKSNISNNESSLDALENKGIEYVEIRSLDINPFSSIGINKKQILLVDLFLIWCTLLNSPHISNIELKNINYNWETIATQGRKPHLSLIINKEKMLLTEIINLILKDLFKIAKCLNNSSKYKKICMEMKKILKNSNLTYSAQILNIILNKGFKKCGLHLSNKYFNKYHNSSFEHLTEQQFLNESNYSYKLQKKIELNN